MAKILSIIAPEDFQDKEYADSKDSLEASGHAVVTASTAEVAYGKFGNSVDVDVLLDDVNPDDYDAIMFIGGPGCADYFDNPTAHKLVQAFYNAGKLTCAICAAPSILANAGLLKGKKVTCWDGESGNLSDKGAIYTGKDVEQDGLIITGSGPVAAGAFGKKIAVQLKA